ncbi:MAG: hypothetical protein ABI462_12850, partial [Ignavibacteria bacterium]
PIPALIEKITNSIDAILTKKCYEHGIEPKSNLAPRSMEDAIQKFFPDNKNWDLPSFRKKQSENIQILADGPRMDTSLIIYDDGEGQNPEDFEATFLSLLKGNKNQIHFVQGKYNMGGSGSIVFCGKKRYQLIASKKYNGKGEFGFTLIRKHPFTEEEQYNKKNTWYEFFKIENKIPSFKIVDLELGLLNRKFKTGTIIKLYSYDLPSGSRSVISRDLNQSINEYLFDPALPLITVDKKERYPDDRNLERDLYGLKRRLEESKNKYVEDYFIEKSSNKEIGTLSITCYVFKTKLDDKNVKESKDSVRREFFKNNMSVLFSMNGQVHGHLTSEFISRTLKMQLLKDYLLIHVDCTNLNYEFRSELFMASRDRLKNGDETSILRETVGKILLNSKLNEIYKRRRDTISFEGEDTKELIQSFTKNLPLNKDLLNLINQTFKLEEKGEKKTEEPKKNLKKKEEIEKFKPHRFPSYFKLSKNGSEDLKIIKIPFGEERSIKFFTDVENDYFVRVEEPGDLKLGLLKFEPNENENGDEKGSPRKVEDVFNIIESNPQDGTIKVVFNPTKDVKIGDSFQIQATLTNPGQDFDQIFWIKISDKDKIKEKVKKPIKDDDNKIGLPELILVYKEKGEHNDRVIWNDLSEVGMTMDFPDVLQLFVEGDVLQKIYVNMDSNVIKNYKSNLKSEAQFELANKKYFTSVYFHTLFLFTISKNKKYSMSQLVNNEEESKEIGDYIKDVFESYYSSFLLNFGLNELIQNLD